MMFPFTKIHQCLGDMCEGKACTYLAVEAATRLGTGIHAGRQSLGATLRQEAGHSIVDGLLLLEELGHHYRVDRHHSRCVSDDVNHFCG